jgi:hypothetical protein
MDQLIDVRFVIVNVNALMIDHLIDQVLFMHTRRSVGLE